MTKDENNINDIIYDESMWPIIVAKFQGEISRERATWYYERIAEILDRQERYVSISDLSGASIKNTELRDVTQSFTAARRQDIIQYNIAAIIAVDNTLVRTTVKAFMRFSPVTTFNLVSARNIDEALVIANQYLQEAGILIQSKT